MPLNERFEIGNREQGPAADLGHNRTSTLIHKIAQRRARQRKRSGRLLVVEQELWHHHGC
jgi:hypothetical protein